MIESVKVGQTIFVGSEHHYTDSGDTETREMVVVEVGEKSFYARTEGSQNAPYRFNLSSGVHRTYHGDRWHAFSTHAEWGAFARYEADRKAAKKWVVDELKDFSLIEFEILHEYIRELKSGRWAPGKLEEVLAHGKDKA